MPQISSGFIISSNIGRMCNDMSRCSRVWVGGVVLMYDGVSPHCVVDSMNRVYVAVISVPNPVIRIVMLDQLNSDVIIVNSAIRLMVGGRAMFVKLARSHHSPISGSKSCMFRVSSSVRL